MNPSRDDGRQVTDAGDLGPMATQEVVRACADRVRRLEAEMKALRTMLESMGSKSAAAVAPRD